MAECCQDALLATLEMLVHLGAGAALLSYAAFFFDPRLVRP